MENFIMILVLLAPLSILISHTVLSKFATFPKEIYFILPFFVYLIVSFLIAFQFNLLGGVSFGYLQLFSFDLSLEFVFDSNNSLMSLLVLIISLCVITYSYKYVSNESKSRYFRYTFFLSLFISSMILFSLSNDLLSSFIFWEFLGLCSFFLIAFYNKDGEANDSSIIAFWLTRLGDLFFLLALVMIGFKYGTLNIDSINNSFFQNSIASNFSNTLPMTFIFIGVLTKCAQYPFTIWLPRAMKGPTPISALIHSATMVVAGVFLLFKLGVIIIELGSLKKFIMFFGAFTALLTSIYAFYQDDLKKILAYSTLSHIGLMLIPFGLNSGIISYFHLYSHSFFKSMLFLLAGYIILESGKSKLSELKGYLALNRPIGIILIIGCLSLVGIYPLTGSFSKEYIYYLAFLESKEIFMVLILSLVFTVLYSSRLLTTLISKRGTDNTGNNENSLYYLIPLIFLAALSLFGPITKDLYFNSLSGEALSISNTFLLSIQVSIFLIFIIYYFYREKIKVFTNPLFTLTKPFVEIEHIFKNTYKFFFVNLGNFVAWFDRNIIDGIINIIPFSILKLSKSLQSLQNGLARTYAFRIVSYLIISLIILGMVYGI